jgi:hypothetical protein
MLLGWLCVCPAADTVVLGGTLGKGDFDTRPREADRHGILDRACRVLPSLRAAEVVSEWVRALRCCAAWGHSPEKKGGRLTSSPNCQPVERLAYRPQLVLQWP